MCIKLKIPMVNMNRDHVNMLKACSLHKIMGFGNLSFVRLVRAMRFPEAAGWEGGWSTMVGKLAGWTGPRALGSMSRHDVELNRNMTTQR